MALGSTCKATMDTHYNTKDITTVRDIDELIVPAARNLVVSIYSPPVSAHSACSVQSLEMNLHSYVTTQLTAYHKLQWVLDSEFGENLEYAKQADCPADLTLHEYLEFARIRAGGTLQFVNIVRALQNGMDFSQLHTFELLTQSLWQVGPSKPVSEKVFVYYYQFF